MNRIPGIKRLRAETGADLAEIRRKLAALGDREFEAWLCTQPLPPEAAVALGIATPPKGQSAARELTAQSGQMKNATNWQRVCLLPGLELMVASDASPAVLRLAQRICEDYVGVAVETARIVPQITSS